MVDGAWVLPHLVQYLRDVRYFVQNSFFSERPFER